MSFRLDIQGMRALAVISVFIFHLNHSLLPGGFLGVDIFFVLSGFLISGIVMKKIEKKEFSFLDFYQSRFKRILPAYYFLLIAVSIAVIFIYFNQDVKFYRKGLLWSSLFNSNNYFSTLDTYFGAKNSENPLLHTWTLAVEMQFYFILPVLLWLFRKRRLLWMILILTIASIVYTQFQLVYEKQVIAMYYSLFARSSEFFIGVLVQMFLMQKITVRKSLQNILSVGGILLVIIPMFLYNEKTLFPGLTAMIPCVGTGLILISHESFLNNFLSNKPFVFVGKLSYSIYLWHWPFMALYRYHYSQYEINFTTGIILTIFILGFSSLSYYFVEEVWRKNSNKIFWWGAASTLVLLALLVVTVVPINEKTGTTSTYYSSSSAMGLTSHGRYFEGLELYGNKNSKNQMLMIGDSHGLVMKPFLNYIGEKNNFSISTISNDTYPPIPGINDKQFSEQDKFVLYKKLSQEASKEIEKRKIIIIIKDWGINLPYFNEALINLFKRFPDKKFIVLSDFPSLNKNPIRVNRGAFRNKTRNVDFKVLHPKLPEDLLQEFQTLPNVIFLDLSDLKLFKDAPYYKDTIMYYDERHLNKFGSEKYGQYAEKPFVEALNKFK